MKSETENKLKEIMSGSGILKIGGEQYKTDSKDLIDLGELGSGTSGHVVKMRHQITGTTIAVKVSSSFGDSTLTYNFHFTSKCGAPEILMRTNALSWTLTWC